MSELAPTTFFGGKAKEYAESRPQYADAVIDELLHLTGWGAGTHIADIGAGTGLFSLQLLARGLTVTLVEPNGPMREEAVQAVAPYSLASVVDGSGEATGLPDGSVDGITVAQAFHWMNPDLAHAEFQRILKPGGWVCLIWNKRDHSDPFQQAIDQLFDHHGGERLRRLVSKEQDQDIEGFFVPGSMQTLRATHQQLLTKDQFLALVFSRSFIPLPNTPEGHLVGQDAEKIFAEFEVDGRVQMTYESIAYVGQV